MSECPAIVGVGDRRENVTDDFVKVRHVADRLEAALEAAPVYVDVSWRELREQADLSLREVARRARVDAAVLSRVERGERRATPDVAQRLAKTLGAAVMRR